MTGKAGVSVSLATLVDRVWLRHDDSPVTVTTGAVPDGHRAVETYAVVPSLRRARYLVPLGSPRASAACLWTYRTMRNPQRRAAETFVSGLFAAKAGPYAFRDRLVVSIDQRVSQHDHASWLVLADLAQRLEAPALFAGMAVRRVQPNSKPMLELFDAYGAARGYAKWAWSAATHRLVRNEAETLTSIEGRLNGVVAPRLSASGTFADSPYIVVAPLPRGLHQLASDPVDAPGPVLEVASSARDYRAPLAGSAYVTHLRRELEAAADIAPDAAQVLGAWLTRLEGNGAALRFGRWHGDWTPHNLGHLGNEVVAWDWEHSRVDVPVGFDALHWHHQGVLLRSGLAAAVTEVVAASHRLGPYGVAPADSELVASLYLLEMFVRAMTQAAGGGGWNAHVYPAMLEVAAARDRGPAETAA